MGILLIDVNWVVNRNSGRGCNPEVDILAWTPAYRDKVERLGEELEDGDGLRPINFRRNGLSGQYTPVSPEDELLYWAYRLAGFRFVRAEITNTEPTTTSKGVTKKPTSWY